MLTRPLLVLLASVLLVHAQENRKQTNFAIFAPPVYTVDKRMDVILVLTPEQESRLAEAYRAMEEDPRTTETRAAFKASDGQKTEEALAAKKAFYEAKEAAEKRYKETVAEILNGDQKNLVETLSSWAAELSRETKDGEGGWNERMARLHQAGQSRLTEVLTPAQIALLGVEPAANP